MSKSAFVPMESIIKASDDQVSTELDHEAVILNLRDGVYYGLNPLASRIWGLIQESRTVREICTILVREYDVEEGRCAADVQELVAQLQEWELIEVVTNGTGREETRD